MDISDGGAEPVGEWVDGGDNVYGSVWGRSPAGLAEGFVAGGWSSRSSSWEGYEVETSFCRVELDPCEGRVLLHGAVDPARFDLLAARLGQLRVRFELELYDEDDRLVREVRGVAPEPVRPGGLLDAIRRPRRSRSGTP